MGSAQKMTLRGWISALGGMLALGLVGYWLGGPRFSDAQPDPAAEQAAPQVRGYRIPPERLDDALQSLRQQFPADTGARFAIDPRSQKVLAVAPADIQARVERHLTDFLAQAAAGSGAAARAAAPADPQENAQLLAAAPRVTRRVLKHATAQELVNTLQATWGRRVSVANHEEESLATLRIPAGDSPAILQLDLKRNVAQLAGSAASHAALERLVDSLDRPNDGNRPALQLLSQERARDAQFRSSLTVLRAALESDEIAQAAAQEEKPAGAKPVAPKPEIDAAAGEKEPAGGNAAGGDAAGGDDGDSEGGLFGPVQIEIVNEFGLIVIRGKKRDVERVEQIIRDLEAKKTALTVQVYALRHANNEGLSTLVNQVYSQYLAARQGTVGIYPLVKPNALLLVGQPESVEAVIELIQKLDRPVSPSAHWRVFPLEFISATEAAQTVNSFYNPRAAGAGGGQGGGQFGGQFQQQQFQQGQQGFPGVQQQPALPVIPQQGAAGAAATGLGTRLEVVADVRSNSLIIRGSPRDLADVTALIKKIDTENILAQSEVRVFKLTNTLARDLATVLNSAIRGQTLITGGATQGGQQGGPGGFQQPQQQGIGGAAGNQPVRSSMLNFLTVDKKGNQVVTTAFPNDVIVTADNNSNSLVVRAPKRTMELVAAIIEELDALPDASAQIKVFTINSSDATYLAQMLQQLFGQQVTIGRGTGGLGGLGNVANQVAQAGLNTGDSALVPLRFAVDARTNSIIASGSAGDLKVVEALLIRLDEDDVQSRRIAVYRLKNSFAQDVTNAVTQFLTAQRQVVQQNLAFNVAIDPFEQLEREVAIAAEPVSNSVVISATPQFYDRVMEIIEKLDFRPPMVMVQVLIAEVRLSDVYEVGVELGLQDSLLFDRGKASLANQFPAPGTPGFNFNGTNLPNANSLAQSNLAGQALSSFGVGRANTALGYGGMVLSAASDSVNVLIRALQDTGRLQVLSRPQIMAIHNRQARVLVGQKVPRITGTTFNNLGNAQNQLTDVDVGLILNIIPQINNDNIVILNVQAERSRVSETQSVTIAITPEGQPITQPFIDNTSAVTTISARDGQTVVFAGLITNEKTNITRGVPYLSNLPLVGNLFKYEFDAERRTELLIVMTPRIIKYDEDYEWLSAVESDRMSWCLSDVVNIHGDVGLRGNNNLFCCENVPVIYPDQDPTGSQYRKPVDGASPSDKLHSQNKPMPSQPITGQRGSRAAPVAHPVYIQTPQGETLAPPAEPPAANAVRPAGWNPAANGPPPPPPNYPPAPATGGYWQPAGPPPRNAAGPPPANPQNSYFPPPVKTGP